MWCACAYPRNKHFAPLPFQPPLTLSAPPPAHPLAHTHQLARWAHSRTESIQNPTHTGDTHTHTAYIGEGAVLEFFRRDTRVVSDGCFHRTVLRGVFGLSLSLCQYLTRVRHGPRTVVTKVRPQTEVGGEVASVL